MKLQGQWIKYFSHENDHFHDISEGQLILPTQ